MGFEPEITANMAEGIILVQASNLSIIYTNKKFDAMFGYETGELTGKDVTNLISEAPGMNPQDIMHNIEQQLTAKGVVSLEFLLRRKEGSSAWSLAIFQ